MARFRFVADLGFPKYRKEEIVEIEDWELEASDGSRVDKQAFQKIVKEHFDLWVEEKVNLYWEEIKE